MASPTSRQEPASTPVRTPVTTPVKQEQRLSHPLSTVPVAVGEDDRDNGSSSSSSDGSSSSSSVNSDDDLDVRGVPGSRDHHAVALPTHGEDDNPSVVNIHAAVPATAAAHLGNDTEVDKLQAGIPSQPAPLSVGDLNPSSDDDGDASRPPSPVGDNVKGGGGNGRRVAAVEHRPITAASVLGAPSPDGANPRRLSASSVADRQSARAHGGRRLSDGVTNAGVCRRVGV